MRPKKTGAAGAVIPPAASKGPVTYFIWAAAVSIAITVAAFIVCAVVLTYTQFDESIVPKISFAVTAISSLAAGFIASRGVKGKGMIYGALAGAVYIAIVMAVLCFSQNGFVFSLNRAAGIAAAVICGAIGGVLGINTKT